MGEIGSVRTDPRYGLLYYWNYFLAYGEIYPFVFSE